MKALSICQPYASLVAAGLKRFETRSWRTKYRGPVVIHASTSTRYLRTHEAEGKASMRRLLALLGDTSSRSSKLRETVDGLPRGAIIGVADLEKCHPINIDTDEGCDALIRVGLTAEEANVGDYSPGRFAWQMRRAWEAEEPHRHVCAGALGLWKIAEGTLAEIVVAELLAQQLSHLGPARPLR